MGLALIFMAVAVGGYLLYGGFSGKLYLEELTFDTMKNMHADPANNILFPMLFIRDLLWGHFRVPCHAISHDGTLYDR